MKRHLILTILGSLALSAFVAQAQDAAAPAAEPIEAPAEAVAQPAAVAEPEVAVEPVAEVAAVDATEAQPAPAAEPAVETAAADAAEPVAAESDMAPAAEATTEAAPAEAEVAPVEGEGTTSDMEAIDAETPAADESILIVIDDTPLLDAIRNLARQANINLIIDPKVGYGQTDASGKAVPQPNVSIRWEDITAEQALDALLDNYGLQRVDNPKAQITRITVKDPAAPDPLVTQTIQLQYAAPSNVVAAVTATFVDKRSKVVADTRTSQLVVVTTEKELVGIEKLVKELDTPTKQVLIEARLVETTMNPSTVKGIDWSGTLKAQNFKFGNGSTFQIPPTADTITPDPMGVNPPYVTPGYPGLLSGILGNPAVLWNSADGFNPSTAFLNADGVSGVLSFLNENTDTKILSSPRTVTLDNETASIEAGTLYPIVNVTAGTSQTTGGSQVNYSNLTIRLDVTPRISANDQINLKVSPRVMRLIDVQKFDAGDGSFDVPIFATRNIDTRVMIPSGNTLVMGGLVQDEQSNRDVKVPVLGDIPVLGYLFRQNAKSRDKKNLIVFITPTIVQDADFQPTTSDYLKTPVSTADFSDEDWTWWDSGKPADWSK